MPADLPHDPGTKQAGRMCISTKWEMLNYHFVHDMAGSTKSTDHFWKDDETELMLTLLKELHILKCIDVRRTRNGELFKRVSDEMREGGFLRYAEQMRVK